MKEEANSGKIVSVRGGVIDAEFALKLPAGDTIL